MCSSRQYWGSQAILPPVLERLMGRQGQRVVVVLLWLLEDRAALGRHLGLSYLGTSPATLSGLLLFHEEGAQGQWEAPAALPSDWGARTVHVHMCSRPGHIRKGWVREAHCSDHVRGGGGGGQRKELVLCNNTLDCRHVSLVVFLPTWKTDCLISLPGIEWKKEPAKTFGENQSLTRV